MPPLRLAILDDLAAHTDSTTADVRKRLGMPRNTVDRQLQALHLSASVALLADLRQSLVAYLDLDRTRTLRRFDKGGEARQSVARELALELVEEAADFGRFFGWQFYLRDDFVEPIDLLHNDLIEILAKISVFETFREKLGKGLNRYERVPYFMGHAGREVGPKCGAIEQILFLT